MKIRVVTGDGRGIRAIYEIEADSWEVVGGHLYIVSEGKSVVVHAEGTWRSVVDTTRFDAAMKAKAGTLDEDSRRGQPTRPLQAI
jgi:hypothetical protein